MREALQKVKAAGEAAGKNTWMIGDAPTLVERGFNFLCLAEPTLYLQRHLATFNAAVKEGRRPAEQGAQDLAGA